MIRRFLSVLAGLVGRRRAERELEEELAFHVEMETRANVDRGLPATEARRQAFAALSGLEQTRLAVRDVRSTVLDALSLDLRVAIRRLRHERAVAAAGILTFALTVGLATAIYSAARAILFEPFSFEQHDRLLSVWKANKDIDFIPLSVPEQQDVRARAASVEAIGGFTRDDFVVIGPRGGRSADAFQVTTNLFEVLGVRAIRGRTFAAGDGRDASEKVVVLGERLWREAFEGDPRVIGRLIALKTQAPAPATPASEMYRVIGVVEPNLEFFYPSRLRAELYVPYIISDASRADAARGVPSLITIARPRANVAPARASAEIASVLTAASREHAAVSIPGTVPRILPLHEELVGRQRPAFLLLAAAAALLLLVGCANVASLLLAAGLARRQEFAARLALGCSRARLIRQLLTEHLVLAMAGGAGGWILAARLTPALGLIAPESLPRAADMHVDSTALAVALALALLAWLASGLLPAVLLTRSSALGLAGRDRNVSRSSRRARHALVFAETTLVALLLAVAALLANGLWRLVHVPTGFRSDRVFAAQLVVPTQSRAGQQPERFGQELLERLRADRRVTQASLASDLPFAWGVLSPLGLPGSEERRWGFAAAADEEYLGLLGIRLLRGRLLEGRDRGNRHVAVVNESLQRWFPGGKALGQRVRVDDEWREIVGVVADVTSVGQMKGQVIRTPGIGRLTLASAYVPLGTIAGEPAETLLCRFEPGIGDPAAFVTQQLHAIAPDGAVRRAGWLADQVGAPTASLRFSTLLVALFAGAALLLAAIGLYGILAHAVGERTTEIGIRSALGARPSQVRWLVVGEGLGLVLGGLALGNGLAVACGRLLRAFLFEVSTGDPWTLASASAMVAAVAALAAYLPARAATRVDPVRALRAE